ncbi:uncharacterized protein Z518_09193 [Rhinocladiella mackenziei CBS 650.93]|uniref:Uncharacterized protein n=1 Tax=Rhinocladiella mackenziei CBS 650.93 TaxID=1442369 RepID=A0A0D2FHL1_9EURO|nr:uncharacterized protein Z518_09193 [Rhinocladiella mackenziei CBS 650.93]KIX01467.1 hypothetical protein Z518_09193 [Rhinocladiella mackenziei CBS 650.93]
MFRFLFPRARTIRVPLRNGDITLQRVSVIKRSKPVLSRLLTTFLTSYCVIKTAGYIFPREVEGSRNIIASEVERLKKEEQSQPIASQWGKHWENAHSKIPKNETSNTEQASESNLPEDIHLMLPIWVRRKSAGPWSVKHPDDKLFQKLQQDKKLLREVKIEVAKLVVDKKLKNDQYDIWLNQIRHNGQVGVALEMVPPLYPPVDYEIPCVWISPNEVSWGWRRLPDNVGGKMDRVFHPIIFAEAFYAGLREFAKASYIITKARISDRYNTLMDRSPSTKNKANTETLASNQPHKTLTADEKAHMRLPVTRLSEKEKKMWLPFLQGEYGEDASRQGYRDLVKSMTYQGAIETACAVFRTNWVRGQANVMQGHVRGACEIKGYLECFGEKGRLHVDVTAVYSVEINSIIGLPVVTQAYVIPDVEKWYEQEIPSGLSAALSSTASQIQHRPPLKRPSPSSSPEASAAESSTGEKDGEK